MLNRMSMLLAAGLLISAPLATAAEKIKLDADGDGKVSYNEYRASKEKAHERQFKKMDSNGDGFIDAAENKAQKDKMQAMREKRKEKT